MSWINPAHKNDDYEQPIPKETGNVKEVYSAEAVHPVEEKAEEQNQSRRQKQQPKKKEEAKDHFDELAQAAETAHVTLVENRSPYRFCIYKKGEEVYIDIVFLDKKGKIVRTIKKNITHEEFHKILQDIGQKEGLFFDSRF